MVIWWIGWYTTWFLRDNKNTNHPQWESLSTNQQKRDVVGSTFHISHCWVSVCNLAMTKQVFGRSNLVGGDWNIWNIRKMGLLTYQNGCFMGFNGWLVVTGTWMDYDFPYIYREFHHPNWLSLHDFSEGWLKTTKQQLWCWPQLHPSHYTIWLFPDAFLLGFLTWPWDHGEPHLFSKRSMVDPKLSVFQSWDP